MGPSAAVAATAALSLPGLAEAHRRNRLWEHCRNNLGIARLLVHEARPGSLVATACTMAIETACRAALEHAGFVFDGDAKAALGRLSAPPEVVALCGAGATPAECLAGTEKVVSWLAGYLRCEAPERHWSI